MFYQLRNRLQRFHFEQKCKGIVDTPPVVAEPGNRVALLSQTRHMDLLMYLLAVKSFARHIPVGAIYIVDDGTLTADDRALLDQQLPDCTVFALQELRSLRCPKGGTWERLLAIAMLNKDHYVIQLDADTLALGELAEVADCVAHSQAFTIGTWDHQAPETMRERRDVALPLSRLPKAHVQVMAEANLDKISGFDNMQYIRGCSAFAGFPQGSFSRERVEDLSEQMHNALGERWSEWGTEQFMSNVIVANTENPMVLPHPKYSDCTQVHRGGQAFVHFIGTCRFAHGTYASMSAQILREFRARDAGLLIHNA